MSAPSHVRSTLDNDKGILGESRAVGYPASFAFGLLPIGAM